MRGDHPLGPRWRSIFFLLGLALAVAFATQILDQDGGRRASLDPGPRPAAARPPGPIASPAGLAARETAPPAAGPAAGEAPGPEGHGFPPGAEGAAEVREIPRLREEMGRPVAVVSGQAIDSAGAPIARVQVTLGDRETLTDSQGEFVLPLKPAPLILHHPEFFPRTIDPEMRRGMAIPDADPARERVIVVLFPGGRVAGRVTGPQGAPVASARATFDGDEGTASITDARGEFQSPILRPGIHHLHVHHPSYQRADLTVNVPPGGGRVPCDLALLPGAPLEIRAVDPSGAPVPDAGVWLVRRERGRREEQRFGGRTGDDGRLTLLWNPAEPGSVRVLAPGYREAVEPLGGTSLEVRLERAPLLQGQVIDRERGLPVRARELILEAETPEGFARAPDRGVLFHTLAAGRFRIGLPPFPGTYRVRASADGDLTGLSDPIPWNGRDDPPPATIHLDRRTALRGQVAAARPGGGSEPVAGARVELHRHDLTEAMRLAYGLWFAAPPAPVRAAVSDPAGGFRFQDLKPAVYRVRVLHPGHAEWLSAPVTVPLEAPLPCLLREGGVLRGSVLGEDGAVEAGIPLILASQGHPFTRFTRSDGQGRYEFRNLAEGRYLLAGGDPSLEGEPAVQTRWAAGRSPGRGSGSHTIAIRAGAEVVYDLLRGGGSLGSLAGKVSTQGAPLAGLPVLVAPAPRAGEPPAGAGPAAGAAAGAEPPPPPELEVKTGADGGFRLEGLEPGTYRITAAGLSGGQTVEVTSGRTARIEIPLPTRAYSAAVLDRLTGEPVAKAGRAEIVRLRSGAAAGEAAPAREPAREPARTAAVEAGRLDLAGLHPGSYRLRVEVPGYVPHEGRFEIAAGGGGDPVREEIRLRPGNTLEVEVHGADDQPYRGKGETVLLRDGVEVHRTFGAIEGSVLLPDLPEGSYILTIRTPRGSSRMKLEIEASERVKTRLGGGAPRPARP